MLSGVRNVIPHLVPFGRCIAPDLIGMGDSDKLADPEPRTYRFVEHRRYLDGLLDTLGVHDRVTLIVHDWGSALGFDWASRNREHVAGIVYIEAFVRPMRWDEWPSVEFFGALRSEHGEDMILERNLFVERVLPASIKRELTDDEMAEYRRPFVTSGESRRPTLTWPREIPLDGEPADVRDIVADYAVWLSGSRVPKLFINADPGAILTGESREFCRSFENQAEITVSGIHFLQEDSADEIGQAIASRWGSR